MGKTTVALGLSVALGKKGSRVCFLDADTGSGDVNSLLGARPAFTLSNILTGDKNLDEVIYEGPSGVDIIPGGNGVDELTCEGDDTPTSLIDKFDELSDYDMVIVDTSSGIAQSNIAFLRAADIVVEVIIPDSVEINEGLSILKILHLNQYSGDMFLLPNMFESDEQVERVVSKILDATKSSFNDELNILAPIMKEAGLDESTINQKSAIMHEPGSAISREIVIVADQICNLTHLTSGVGAGSYIHRVASFASDKNLTRLLKKYLAEKSGETLEKEEADEALEKDNSPLEMPEEDVTSSPPMNDEHYHLEIVEEGLHTPPPVDDEDSAMASLGEDLTPILEETAIAPKEDGALSEEESSRIVELLEKIVGSLEKNSKTIVRLERGMESLSNQIAAINLTSRKATPGRKKLKQKKPDETPQNETSFLMEVTEYDIPGSPSAVVPPAEGGADIEAHNVVKEIIRKRGSEKFSTLADEELRIANSLLQSDAVTEDEFHKFAKLRYKFDTGGKNYLGDILLKRKLITKDILKEFLKLNNNAYKKFCSVLRDQGLMSKDQFQEIMTDKKADDNIVAVISKHKVMSKASFMKLFSSVGTALKFGEWLVKNEHVPKSEIDDALREQGISSFEDYLIYNKLIDKDTLDNLKYQMGLN